MTNGSAPALRYVLPVASISLSVSRRLAVAVDDAGGHLDCEVEVRLSAPWRREPLTSTCRFGARSADGLDDGAAGAVLARPGSLREQFDRRHPHLAALIVDLSARAEQYLAALRMDEDHDRVLTVGRALEIVHRELAAADRTRREWISRQERELGYAEWDLAAADLVHLAHAEDTLPADTAIPSGPATTMARDFGLLVAVWSGDDPVEGSPGAGIGVYRRVPLPDRQAPPDQQDDPTAEVWVRDEALSGMRLSDSSRTGAKVPSPRGHDEQSGQPSSSRARIQSLESAIRAARVQLELLEASDEYTRLACAQHRVEEIEAMQHQVELTYSPSWART